MVIMVLVSILAFSASAQRNLRPKANTRCNRPKTLSKAIDPRVIQSPWPCNRRKFC
ncbi:hypothetical protein [Sulfuricaulis sp.]|uniref:hypothetical protein n=1 Tax=Sulfuricaulis sp. TaxID=2003553 RepID=UPI00345CD0D5